MQHTSAMKNLSHVQTCRHTEFEITSSLSGPFKCHPWPFRCLHASAILHVFDPSVICFLERFSNQVLQLDLICNDVLAHRLAPTVLHEHMSLDCGIHNDMLVCVILFTSPSVTMVICQSVVQKSPACKFKNIN